MADRSASSSEQYVKKSNRAILFLGLGLLLLFLLAYCGMSAKHARRSGETDSPIAQGNDPDPRDPSAIPGNVEFNLGYGNLVSDPSEVSMSGVVLGSQAESIVTLKAEGSPIIIQGLELAEEQQDGFKLGGTCQANTEILKDSTCLLKVLWNPVSLRQIQNTLTIRWRENAPNVFEDKTLVLRLTAQSTDSKDCVICESKCNDKEAERNPMAATFDGKDVEIGADGKVKIGDKEYVVKDGLLIDPKTGEIVGIADPEKLPLGLDNKVLGTISKTRDVLSVDGKALGRLLGDDTIVDSSLKVLGAAVPVVSVMNDEGKIIGKLVKEGNVVDGTGAVIGRPRADNSVVDLEGKHIGYLRPYGLVAGFTGKIIGGVVSDGSVVNSDSQTIGYVKPNGFVANPDGEMIGGVVMTGVAVGPSCQSLGQVLMSGRVKDSYNQIIGSALLDGSVVNEEGRDLGSVISQGLIINEKGSVVGFVNSAGKAVDSKGQVIGCVNPDGRVAAGNKAVGAVMPKGFVVGQGCQAIGSVYPNGVVMNANTEVVGQVRPDSYVINTNNKIIGVVVPRGSAIADGCRMLGLISPSGQVLDSNGKPIGCMTMEGKVINQQNENIGFVAPKGVVVDKEGLVIGRVRIDGKVIDKDGKIIGCVNSNGEVVSTDGKSKIGSVLGTGATNTGDGVILDENGDATGWTAVGHQVFDENGRKAGTLQQNGWITNEAGEIVRVMPPDGVIVSHEGLILGRYSKKTGVALTLSGERFGVVLPDFSVLDGAKEKVIGLLIPDNTPFMDMNNKYLATMGVDGVLTGAAGETIGVVRSDGTVVNKSGQLIGMKMPQGKVLSAVGQEIGSVNTKGEVISNAQSVIGHILANGIAVSKEGRVIGGVFPEISLPMSGEGIMGSLTVEGKVNDLRGRALGTISPFGTVIGDKDTVAGRLLRIGPYVDMKGQLLGWSSFKGELLNKKGVVLGSITLDGVAIDIQGTPIGTLIPRGVVISPEGSFMGAVSTNGQVIASDGKIMGTMTASRYLTSDKEGVLGQLVIPSVAVDAKGSVIGWTRADGTVVDQKGLVGRMGLNGRVMQASGQVVGQCLPLGAGAISTKSAFMGVVSGDGALVNRKGEKIATLTNDTFVVQNGKIAGRLLTKSLSANDNINGHLAAMGGLNGQMTIANDNKPYGTVMANGLVVDLTKKVVGGLSPTGLALNTKLTTLGQATLNGQVLAHGQLIGYGVGSGTGATLNSEGQFTGGISPMGLFIGREGSVIGHSSGTADILDKSGKKIANYMPFGSALTQNSAWAGGVMPVGLAINDDGYDIGVVALDGALIGKDEAVMARIMTDGTAVGVSDRNLFTTMPYAGHIVQQGLPFGYRNTVLGRTTVGGDIIDASDKKVYRELDDGTILGTDMPLEGRVLAFNPAISHDGHVLGSLDGEGTIRSYAGEEIGKVAVNGTIKGNHKYKISGALIPEQLVVNNCKVVGQTAYNGQVVNGQGQVVGRMTPDKWAVDMSNNKIGRAVRVGLVAAQNGDYIGRTMPDSTVVDLNGVNLGCAQNDGSVVNGVGEVVGAVVERGLVLDKDGNPVGRVKADGTVVDKAGKAIGKVLGDGKGTVVDANGREIARVVSPDEELIFNADGSIAGTLGRDGLFKDPQGNEQFQVLPDGRIIDPKTGEQIGELTADGKLKDMAGNEVSDLRILRDADGNIIGTIDDEGHIINPDGQVIGQIMPDGKIVDNNGNVIGQINPDGSVEFSQGAKGKKLKKGEYTLDGNKVYGADGKLIGILGEDGKIRDLNGNVIGQMNPDGSITLNGQASGTKTLKKGDYTLDGNKVYGADGELIGILGEDGKIRDLNGNVIGQMNPDGSITLNGKTLKKGEYTLDGNKVYGPDGKLIGILGEDGKIRDLNGNVIGKMNPDGSITLNSKTLKKGDYTLDGNKVYGPDGKLIGILGEDGKIRDLNGNVIGQMNPDGSITLYGNSGSGLNLGTISGDLSIIAPNLDTQQGGSVAGGRRIFIGDKVFDVTPNGSLVDKDGTIVGYMGPDGRPRDLADNLLVIGGADNEGRIVPITTAKKVITPEQAAAQDELVSTRRAAMKQKINTFSRLLPDGKTLARARQKQDLDWGEAKIVSTYPVDMSRMILKDKAIPAVLAHSIDSRFTSVPVTAIVERHIYAESGRRIIIPAGSRLIGTAGGGGASGSGSKHVNKMEISWTRLIRPDGSAFQLSATSGDAQGRGGVAAYLDEQLLKKYGKPVLSSTLTSAIAFLTATNDDYYEKENGDKVVNSKTQAANDARSNFIDSMSQIFTQLLEEATEYDEVVFVPAGTRMTVYSNADLWLRSDIEDEQDYEAQFGADGKSIKGTSQGNWEEARKPELEEQAAAQGIATDNLGTENFGTDDYYDPTLSGEPEPLYNGGETAAPVSVVDQREANKKKSKSGATAPVFPSNNSGKKLF